MDAAVTTLYLITIYKAVITCTDSSQRLLSLPLVAARGH
jgi:hypothetical protein